MSRPPKKFCTLHGYNCTCQREQLQGLPDPPTVPAAVYFGSSEPQQHQQDDSTEPTLLDRLGGLFTSSRDSHADDDADEVSPQVEKQAQVELVAELQLQVADLMSQLADKEAALLHLGTVLGDRSREPAEAEVPDSSNDVSENSATSDMRKVQRMVVVAAEASEAVGAGSEQQAEELFSQTVQETKEYGPLELEDRFEKPTGKVGKMVLMKAKAAHAESCAECQHLALVANAVLQECASSESTTETSTTTRHTETSTITTTTTTVTTTSEGANRQILKYIVYRFLKSRHTNLDEYEANVNTLVSETVERFAADKTALTREEFSEALCYHPWDCCLTGPGLVMRSCYPLKVVLTEDLRARYKNVMLRHFMLKRHEEVTLSWCIAWCTLPYR